MKFYHHLPKKYFIFIITVILILVGYGFLFSSITYDKPVNLPKAVNNVRHRLASQLKINVREITIFRYKRSNAE